MECTDQESLPFIQLDRIAIWQRRFMENAIDKDSILSVADKVELPLLSIAQKLKGVKKVCQARTQTRWCHFLWPRGSSVCPKNKTNRSKAFQRRHSSASKINRREKKGQVYLSWKTLSKIISTNFHLGNKISKCFYISMTSLAIHLEHIYISRKSNKQSKVLLNR